MPTMLSSVLFVASLIASVAALPLAPREVVAPHILYPTAGTVWTVGSTQTVTWNTSQLPPYNEQTNPIGELILGYHTTSPPSENLMLQSPLASGFNLSLGSIDIVVPNVPYGTLYIIDLMGDSGNITPDFTISGGTVSENPVSYLLSSAAASSTAPAPASVAASTTPLLQTAASSTTLPSSGVSSISSGISSGVSPVSSGLNPGGPVSGASSASSSATSSATSPAASPSANGASSLKGAHGIASVAMALFVAYATF